MTPPSSAGTVAEFRGRAKAWLEQNMPRIDPQSVEVKRDSEAVWLRARELQRRLYDGGFAGICFPREYGGLGLGYDYLKAFNEESVSYELPLVLNVPSFAICCATLLDTASEEMKCKHINAALRGDEVLVQLLSEPSGGSDLAGVITRAERVGDKWILNGAKTWSSSAFAADYGLCLARTDWSVPKHEGLTMFLVPMDAPRLTLRRIRQVNGSDEFCEEFFDDVELSDEHVVGDVNDGWAVASRQLFHERRAVGKSSEFSTGIGVESAESTPLDFVGLLRNTGGTEDPSSRVLAGRALTHRVVRDALAEHIYLGVAQGAMPAAAGSLIRLAHGVTSTIEIDTALALADTGGVIGESADVGAIGIRYLARQSVCLGGGTLEIARNIIGERVLDFPREYAADRGVPFNEVRRGRTP
jgi:alkylation response protein AidB-like acyl-CoA dehydrogenase